MSSLLVQNQQADDCLYDYPEYSQDGDHVHELLGFEDKVLGWLLPTGVSLEIIGKTA